MRLRTIKPGFFHNEALADVHPLGRILFAGLWCLADREGRLEDRPKRIKAEILPYDDCDVNALLDDLARSGFILRYVAQNSHFIWIVKFRDHQYPHIREAASIIPAPDEHSASMVLAPDKALAQPVGYSVNPLIRSSVHPFEGVNSTPLFSPLEQPEPPHPPRESPEPGSNHVPRRAAKNPPELAPEARDKLIAKWSGTLPDVESRIDAALNHTAVKKAINTERYVDTWLRNDAARVEAVRATASLAVARLADNGHGPPEEPLNPNDPEWADKQSERERRRQAARYSTGGG